MTDEKDDVVENHDHDPYFEPLIHLPPVETKTLEEDEEEYTKLRAKLFRYDSAAEPPEWKERGTGDVKILRHKETSICRVLMRRDKTLKICANHYVLPHMELKPNCGSERAWVWSTQADFADEEKKPELLAIRFANVENAQKFKAAFDKAKETMEKKLTSEMGKGKHAAKDKEDQAKEDKGKDETKETEKLTDKIEELSIKENGDSSKGSEETNQSKDKPADTSQTEVQVKE